MDDVQNFAGDGEYGDLDELHSELMVLEKYARFMPIREINPILVDLVQRAFGEDLPKLSGKLNRINGDSE